MAYNNIGNDWFANQDQWHSVRDKTNGYMSPEDIAKIPMYVDSNNSTTGEQVYNPEWLKANAHGADGYRVNNGGESYIIRDNYGSPLWDNRRAAEEDYYRTMGIDPGKRNEFSVSKKTDGNAIEAYNGVMQDWYDKDGKFNESRIGHGYGEIGRPFWVDAAIIAAMVGTAGVGGAYAGGAAAGSGGTAGATLGEGALAASGNYGLAAGTAGAAGTNAAAAGAAGAGSAAGAGGAVNPNVSGADLSTYYGDYGSTGGTYGGSGVTDLGGGVTMGADGSISSGGTGSGLTGTAPPTAPGYGAPASTGGGSTLSGMTGQTAFSVPGIGNVSYGDLLKLATTAYGAYSGGQGQEATTTTTKELPEWLQGPVYGQGGVVPGAQSLMNQQMYGNGLLATQQAQAQALKKKKDKEKARKGLLNS